MNELEQFVSDDGEYIIPVEWKVSSNVVITGVKNLKEALEVAKRYEGDLPITEDCDYIDESYTILEEEEDLLNAQTHRKRGVYFENPKKED